MIKQRITLSTLSALLICSFSYAQIQIDTTLAVFKPIIKKTPTTNYWNRTQRHTGIPTIYVDIFDGLKTNGVLDTFGEDYKYDSNNQIIYETDKNGNYKLDENGNKIPKTNGYKHKIYNTNNGLVTIYNTLVSRNKNLTTNMREERWQNYFKTDIWAAKDKNYDIARIHVIDASGGMKQRDELVRLRGRGNSTWQTAKRSYRLKFPNKTALLSLSDGTNTHADAKSWTLIANAFDKSMIRNALTSEIGKKVGIPFNVSYKLVDMYFNNEYYGCYQVADQIAIGGRRIDIDEDEGWLMEAVATETKFLSDPYITVNIPGVGSGTINIKNPEVAGDNASDPKITAIANWLSQVNFSDHSEETGYRKYVDIYSLADYLVVLDITGNYDGCISNYMYKDKGANDKLKFGPIWDNDLSFGNFYGDNNMKYTLMRDGAKRGGAKGWTQFSSLVNVAMDDAVFMKALMRKWNKVYPTMQSFIASKVSEIADANIAAIGDNNTVWPTTQDLSPGSWTGSAVNNYEDALYRINQYSSIHLPWVNEQYTNYYNAFKTTTTIRIDAASTNNSTSPFSSVSNKICTTYVQNKSFSANTWTTICLPFNLDEDELKTYFGEEVKLAEYSRLEGAGTLMVFKKQKKLLLEAGVPYLICPSKVVTNPTFTEVAPSIQTPKTIKISSSDAVGFTGTFFKTNIPTTNVSTLQGIDFNKDTSGVIEGVSAYVSGSSIVSLQIEGEVLTPPIALGDVNEDGSVSILDLTVLINYLLSENPAAYYTPSADMNGDGSLSILDVTMLINLILSQPAE